MSEQKNTCENKEHMWEEQTNTRENKKQTNICENKNISWLTSDDNHDMHDATIQIIYV